MYWKNGWFYGITFTILMFENKQKINSIKSKMSNSWEDRGREQRNRTFFGCAQHDNNITESPSKTIQNINNYSAWGF